MPRRNVSLIGRSAQGAVPFFSSLASRFRNYAVVVWSPGDPLMLHLELHETWSDENFVLFKRVPREPLHELVRRKEGTTTWPDESIIAQGWYCVLDSFLFFSYYDVRIGMQIIKRGPPYVSKRWHVFWPDHQCFVEELSDAIMETPRPKITPPRLLVYRGPDALKNWNKKGPPMGTPNLSKQLSALG
jgi:hypothetical protein